MVGGWRIPLVFACNGDNNVAAPDEDDGSSEMVPHQFVSLFGSVVVILEKLV
jgi:hypothetical protein